MSAFNLPSGVTLADIEGQQESDDEAMQRELEKADRELDLRDGDVDKTDL